MHRVLKPGGVIGIADADHDTSIIYPPDPLLDRWLEVVREMRLRTSGGDVRIGQKLRALLADAGFERTAGSPSPAPPTAPTTARASWAPWQAAYLEDPAHIAEATRLGVSDEPELRAIADAWRRWGDVTRRHLRHRRLPMPRLESVSERRDRSGTALLCPIAMCDMTSAGFQPARYSSFRQRALGRRQRGLQPARSVRVRLAGPVTRGGNLDTLPTDARQETEAS